MGADGFEPPRKPSGKTGVPAEGAAKSAASGADSFAEAVAGIMRLPLTDAERAEAVRRLLDHDAKGKA
jgi:hypothetical protein